MEQIEAKMTNPLKKQIMILAIKQYCLDTTKKNLKSTFLQNKSRIRKGGLKTRPNFLLFICGFEV
jgi:hypothetical protein